MAAHAIHPHEVLGVLQHHTIEASSIEEMRAALTARLGPFPFLFEGPYRDPPLPSPCIVVTAIIDIPGAAERGGPFLGAQMIGYVQGVGPRVGTNGVAVTGLGIVKTPAYLTHTEEVVVGKPYEGPPLASDQGHIPAPQ